MVFNSLVVKDRDFPWQNSLKNPEILILDEATSSLDSLSELEIQESIKKLKSLYNITVIIVAHRLSTVKKADKIIILNNGEIQDQGTYENLKNKKNELFDAMMFSFFFTKKLTLNNIYLMADLLFWIFFWKRKKFFKKMHRY